MPLVDISSVLLSPMVAGEGFTVLRRRQVVSTSGVAQAIVTARIPALGSVRPTGDNSLTREVAYESQTKSMRVVTTFRLRGVAKDGQGDEWLPDIILWKGVALQVIEVEDYSSYGPGTIQADCMSVDYVDRPPTSVPAQVGVLNFSLAASSPLLPIARGVL